MYIHVRYTVYMYIVYAHLHVCLDIIIMPSYILCLGLETSMRGNGSVTVAMGTV